MTSKNNLPGMAGFQTLPLGFGCATLLGRASRTQSLNALHHAWEGGIRFFDIARSYGYGEAEGLLGEFLSGRRDDAIVSTKFGILPAKQSGWKQVARAMARQTLALAPSLRSRLKRHVASQFTSNQFTPTILAASIEESLLQLRTNYVDYLFLHSPTVEVLEQDDLFEALSRLVESGKVRAIGISSDPVIILRAQERRPGFFSAFQFVVNALTLKDAINLTHQKSNPALHIANQPFGGIDQIGTLQKLIARLKSDSRLAPNLRAKFNLKDTNLLPDFALNLILRCTCIELIIPTMMTPKHIDANLLALTNSRFTAEEISSIAEILIS